MMATTVGKGLLTAEIHEEHTSISVASKLSDVADFDVQSLNLSLD